ncbi:MAG TPA: flagellar motor switch protein FliN [bacterium]|nr:flagellar motor switch protein FliN [bacterium]
MSLSQEEIDALLKGQGDIEKKKDGSALDDNAQVVLDSFGTLWNESIADALAGHTEEPLGARVTDVGSLSVKDIRESLTDEDVVFFVGVNPPLKTPMLFLFPAASCARLGCLLSGQEMQDELTDEHRGVLANFWDQIAGIWAAKLSDKYGLKLRPDSTQVMLGSEMLAGMDVLYEDIVAPIGFVECLLDFPTWLEGMLRCLFGKDVIDALEPIDASAPSPTKKAAAPKPQPVQSGRKTEAPTQTLQPVVFEPLVQDAQPSEPSNLDLILDIKMEIRVELGRTNYKVREILELCPGYVVELNKLAGEPVDLLVNDKLFARGEVVVIDENFGVRITEILSLKERIESLR